MTHVMAARGTVVALAVLGLLSGLEGPAVAQEATTGFGVTAPPPRPAPELGIEPTQPADQQGAREQEFYPGLVRSRHEPAFITPFVATVPTSPSSAVRVGLSGWTAPAVPFDIPQASGGVAFGLTILWPLPVPKARPPEPEAPPQR